MSRFWTVNFGKASGKMPQLCRQVDSVGQIYFRYDPSVGYLSISDRISGVSATQVTVHGHSLTKCFLCT